MNVATRSTQPCLVECCDPLQWPGRRNTARSDIAPSGVGVASWVTLCSDHSSGVSAPPLEDNGNTVVSASSCDPMTAATSAAPQFKAAPESGPDPGSKRTTLANFRVSVRDRRRWRRKRVDGGGPELRLVLITSGSGRWCPYGSGHVAFLGRNSPGIVHGREMYHGRRGSSS